MTDAGELERRERERRERDEELQRLAKIDPASWPRHVRRIGIGEMSGLGVDRNGRLYWNGRPVEIIGQRLDLTWPQLWVAIAVAVFTFVAAGAGAFQAWS